MTTFAELEQEARARSYLLLERMSAEYMGEGGDLPERIAAQVDIETAILLGFAHTALIAAPMMKMLGSRRATQQAERLEALKPEMTPGQFERVPEAKIRAAFEENWPPA